MSSILLYSTRKTQKLDRIAALKGGTLWDFLTFLSQYINKIEEEPPLKSLKYFRKKPHNAEKTDRGDPLGFFNISVAKHQKN